VSLAAGLLWAGAAACGDDSTPSVVSTPTPDAGVACELGSENCACVSGSGCRGDLLCIAGRCLAIQGRGESEPPPERPRPQVVPNRPLPVPPVITTMPESGDAGAADGGGSSDAAAGEDTSLGE
jgi:hypothetical protein